MHGHSSKDDAPPGWHADEEIVDRLIRCDWDVIHSRLTDPAAMVDVPMHFDEPFERVDRLAEFWRAAGRIERHGHLERIEIEVSKASETTADLRILPWREHRLHLTHTRRDWFADIADHLEVALTGDTIDIRPSAVLD